ncbi:50S ribosomal protein L22 [Candidatus Woesearchaeota archaeon]|nr:50S ribosomal protein L22 [Candidatus Woesearchaeota archaeon]
MAQQTTTKGIEHQASAKSLNIPVSTKHSIEIAKAIRYKTTSYAKQLLADVVALKRPIEFRTFKNNIGHKPGMAAGRFPEKAARQFLKLVHAVEANAQFKGLNVDDLKIVKMTANLASIPSGGGRLRHKTKRTHLEIVVKERTPAQKKSRKKEAKETTGEASPATKTVESEPSLRMAEGKPEVKNSAKQPLPSQTPRSSGPVHLSVPKTEPNSQDLLKKAQARAAELNKGAAAQKSVEEVSKLYSELSKKGTLRDAKPTMVKQS